MSMRVVLKGKRAELTPAIRTYVEAKIVGPAEKLVGVEDCLLEFELSRATRHHRKGPVWWAEANMTFGKHVIRAEHNGEDPHAAIDCVEEELLREIKTYKGKRKTKDIRKARTIKRALKRQL